MERDISKKRISRRMALKGIGLGAALPLISRAEFSDAYINSQVKSGTIGEMKITKVESIHFSEKLKIGGGSGGSGAGTKAR